VSASALPSGDDARRLELSHVYLTAPVRLNTGRPGPPGSRRHMRRSAASRSTRKGGLFVWIAYVATPDAPELSVWPAAGRSVTFD
jgi:hypothetical protein